MKEKIVVILGDGMADEPDENGATPLTLAKKPAADKLARRALIGLCKTVPDGMSPGSDTANLSVLGYDPKVYYTGRSPLEAASIGITLNEGDVTYRANLVTLKDGLMQDYSAGEISTAEAKVLIEYLAQNLGFDGWELYSGVSYRHCLVHRGAHSTGAKLTPPHDISGRLYSDHLPKGNMKEQLNAVMEKSQLLLKDHPVNLQRRKRGLNEAVSLWLWGEGTKPKLDNFQEKFGLKGCVISAVDLLKGIAVSAGMRSIDVEGATGTVSTNFDGKAAAAIEALKEDDYIYVHLEAPDECGHQGDRAGKIRSIELIDEKIITPIYNALEAMSVRYKLLFMPDHPTPLSKRTHTADSVPFLLYDSGKTYEGEKSYDEFTARGSGVFVEQGCLMTPMLKDFN